MRLLRPLRQIWRAPLPKSNWAPRNGRFCARCSIPAPAMRPESRSLSSRAAMPRDGRRRGFANNEAVKDFALDESAPAVARADRRSRRGERAGCRPGLAFPSGTWNASQRRRPDSPLDFEGQSCRAGLRRQRNRCGGLARCRLARTARAFDQRLARGHLAAQASAEGSRARRQS